MTQLLHTLFITNNRASFHLWWKENLIKHQKVPQHYFYDCSYKIDDQKNIKPPTANSSFQKKKLDYDSESNYKDLKSENAKHLACLISLSSFTFNLMVHIAR